MSTSEDPTADLVKAVAYFDADAAPEGSVGSESFWAAPLLEHPATDGVHLAVRVDNLLVWAPFTLDDVVLVTVNDDQRLQVIAVLERSGCTSTGIFVEYDENDSAAEAAAGLLGTELANACRAHGARTERFGPTAICVQLPADVSGSFEREDAWVDTALSDVLSNAADGLEVNISVTHAAADPMTVDWLDTSLTQAPPDQTYTGPANGIWHAEADPGFATAVVAARAEGHIPAWMPDDRLAARASELWLGDARVRSAIAARGYRGVAIFAFRVSAPPGTVLPPLDGPLL